jgi:hypothetical protein
MDGDNMIKKTLATILLVTLLLVPVAVAPRTPSTTTIPPITAQSAGVIFLCQPFQAFPGSVTTGASGFIRIQCSDNFGALVLDGSLTPTFQLGIGYVQAGIVFHNTPNGSPCSYNFRQFPVGNVTVPTGVILNRTLTFSSNPVQGQMLTAMYDYCLQYINAPSTGLAGFNIVWT